MLEHMHYVRCCDAAKRTLVQCADVAVPLNHLLFLKSIKKLNTCCATGYKITAARGVPVLLACLLLLTPPCAMGGVCSSCKLSEFGTGIAGG